MTTDLDQIRPFQVVRAVRALVAGPRTADDVAAAAGVAPAQLPQILTALARHGVRTEKHSGAYRLQAPYDLLDSARVTAALGDLAPDLVINLLEQCASTNSEVLNAPPRSGHVTVCELQSAGRGRRGRVWHSGLGDGLTFTLGWRFARPASSLSALSLCVGIALVTALERLGVDELALKWPNDVLLRQRKLAGTLIEIRSVEGGDYWVAIGVGLNVRVPPAVGAEAIGLAEVVADRPSRNELLASLLVELAGEMTRFAADGFAPVRHRWLTRHAWNGRRVQVGGGADVAVGVVAGVSDDGALELNTEAGMQRIYQGELSLRLAP